MKTIAFIAFLFVSQISLAQKLTIRGQVSTSDGKPAPQVSITLKNHKKSTVADQAGQFRFNNLAPGNYTIIASYVGLKNQEQDIALSDTDMRIEFVLLEDSRALEEIIVNGNYKATKKESDYISRMPLKDIETPQVYNIVGKEIMEQQITTDYKQSLRNIAGGGVAYGFVNNGFAYTVLRGFWTGVRMRNGVASSNWSGIDPAVVNVRRL